MIHPQKRMHVKKVLELVIRRIIELKHELVRWNPPNSYVRIPQGPEEAFPWEYINLDDILVDLKLSPETLEVPIPRYFKEDHANVINQRDNFLKAYMQEQLSTDAIYIDDQYETPVPIENMDIQRAVDIIQRNERGRQGFVSAQALKSMRDKSLQKMSLGMMSQNENDATSYELHVINAQRTLRGFFGRSEALKERENELMFIGMANRRDNVEILTYELSMAHIKRKQEQIENKALYEQALDDLKEIIVDEEGPEKRDELREERTLWVTDQIAQEKFPDNLDEFYAAKLGIMPEPEDDGKGKGKGKGKKDAKADAKKKADKKGGKKGGKAEAKEPPAMPKLQGRNEVTENMAKALQGFEETWANRNEDNNFQQRHDVELAKDVIRPNIYDDLRKKVDEILIMNLKKIKLQVTS